MLVGGSHGCVRACVVVGGWTMDLCVSSTECQQMRGDSAVPGTPDCGLLWILFLK